AGLVANFDVCDAHGPADSDHLANAEKIATACRSQKIDAQVDGWHAGANLRDDRVIAEDIDERADDAAVQPIGAILAQKLRPERKTNFNGSFFGAQQRQPEEALIRGAIEPDLRHDTNPSSLRRPSP